MKQRTTMRVARRQFAGRECVTPATYKTVETAHGTHEKVIDTPRVRRRHVPHVVTAQGANAMSFRAWARDRFARADPSTLSPKLARIVAQGAR